MACRIGHFPHLVNKQKRQGRCGLEKNWHTENSGALRVEVPLLLTCVTENDLNNQRNFSEYFASLKWNSE